MKTNERELATVLAALRFYQATLANGDGASLGNYGDIASDLGRLDPLSDEEIDDLCQGLNRPDDTELDLKIDEAEELASAVRGLKVFGGDGGTDAEERVIEALKPFED